MEPRPTLAIPPSNDLAVLRSHSFEHARASPPRHEGVAVREAAFYAVSVNRVAALFLVSRLVDDSVIDRNDVAVDRDAKPGASERV